MEVVTHFRGLINIVRRSGSDGRSPKRQMTRRAAAAVLRRFPESDYDFSHQTIVLLYNFVFCLSRPPVQHIFHSAPTLDKFIRMLHGGMEMEINLFLGRKLIYVPFSCVQSEICCDSLNSFSSHFWRLLRRWKIYVVKTKKRERREKVYLRDIFRWFIGLNSVEWIKNSSVVEGYTSRNLTVNLHVDVSLDLDG